MLKIILLVLFFVIYTYVLVKFFWGKPKNLYSIFNDGWVKKNCYLTKIIKKPFDESNKFYLIIHCRVNLFKPGSRLYIVDAKDLYYRQVNEDFGEPFGPINSKDGPKYFGYEEIDFEKLHGNYWISKFEDGKPGIVLSPLLFRKGDKEPDLKDLQKPSEDDKITPTIS